MKINVRQICFIMVAYTAVSRLLLYPTDLSGIAGRDLIFPAIVNFAICTAAVWAVGYLCSKTDKTFFGLLENTFGNTIARIVYCVFALFLMLSSIVPVFEHKLYVHTVFYDTVPSLLVFLPFFAFAVYAGSKQFNNVGRCADICFPVFAVALAMIFAMSVGEADFGNLFPVLNEGVGGVARGCFYTLFRFVEPCWLLMFMGRFDYRKGDCAKITISYIIGGLIVIAFLCVYRGIYGDITTSRQFAVSKTALFFAAVETVGRIDLLVLYLLEIPMLFALVMNIRLAVECFSEAFNTKKRGGLSLCVNAVLVVILVCFNHSFFAINEAYMRWIWIVTLIFAVFSPILAWTLKRREAK